MNVPNDEMGWVRAMGCCNARDVFGELLVLVEKAVDAANELPKQSRKGYYFHFDPPDSNPDYCGVLAEVPSPVPGGSSGQRRELLFLIPSNEKTIHVTDGPTSVPKYKLAPVWNSELSECRIDLLGDC